MEECGFAQGMMFNDFEAQALSLPALRDEWLLPIGRTGPNVEGTRLITGPGTGLGTAALLMRDDKWIPVPTESGHMDFAPVRDVEHQFWPLIEKREGRITAETLLSGAGLQRLHRARQAAAGMARSPDDGVKIVAQALADPHSFAAQTIYDFWLLLARFVGDIAITFVATGGVTLAGGIVPRIISLCPMAAFRLAFENKAPYEHIMAGINVHMINVPDSVLAGLAHVAATPARFLLDHKRLWA
jgi:glucokinase